MGVAWHSLAQSSRTQQSTEIFWILAILVAVAIVTSLIILIIRRAYLREDAPEPEGFTLSDLRRMHKDGKLSDEEFDAAKGLVVERSVEGLSDDDTDPQEVHIDPAHWGFDEQGKRHPKPERPDNDDPEPTQGPS